MQPAIHPAWNRVQKCPADPDRRHFVNSPHLRRWGVTEIDTSCALCGKPCTLRHVLNACSVALFQGRYTNFRRVLRGVCRLLANPLSQKKKKKGRCASTAANLAAATKPYSESTSHFRATYLVSRNTINVKEARRVYPALGAWNWGVVPQYPPCPHKRFRRVSWQTGQFSAANLVSLRS